MGKNEFCDIRGVVFCGPPNPPITLALPLAAVTPTAATTFGWPDGIDNDDDHEPRAQRKTTPGPLRVDATDQCQLDGSDRNFCGLRFQLDIFQQQKLCPGRQFITFIAKEGFFESCIGTSPNRVCVRERCKVDLNGIGPNDPPRLYGCERL
jgi:hypothetical protein